MIDTTTYLEIHGNTSLTRSEAQDAWPNVSYRGEDIADVYPRVLEHIVPRLEEQSAQECFLSYHPGEDTFTIVFDSWFSDLNEFGEREGECDFGFQLVEFTVTGDKVRIKKMEIYDIAGWYGHGWKIWKAKNPQYVDLRLD